MSDAAPPHPSRSDCLYNDIRYGSPRIPYQPLAETQNVSPRDAVSSWKNNSGLTVCAYNRRTGLSDQLLFFLTANGGHREWGGAPVNDRADFSKPC